MKAISTAKYIGTDGSKYRLFSEKKLDSENALVFHVTSYSWSPCVWSKGIRKKKNFRYCDFLALDFDDTWSIEDAKIFLDEANAWGIIGTTKSHQKEKGGITCDRFRLIMKWDKRIDNVLQYEQNVDRLLRVIPADQACRDGGRFFFPCTEIVHISQGIGAKVLPYKKPATSPRPRRNLPYEKEYRLVPQWMRAELSSGVPEGNRNSSAFRFTLHLKERGFSEDQIFNTLAGGISLTETELRRTIQSGFRYTKR